MNIFDSPLIFLIVTALVTLLGFITSYWFNKKQRRRSDISREEADKLLRSKALKEFSRFSPYFTGDADSFFTNVTSGEDTWKGLITSGSPIVPMSHEEIDEAVDNRVRSLNERILGIEKKLEQYNDIDKIEVISSAVLSTQIDGLKESLKKIEENMLTQWDVVKIVFTIITVLIVIIGAAIPILLFVINKTTVSP